ncbi:MAG: DUF4350 domain-containing protein [Neisseria sp.]|nr:DUF4350 domain-containing protein [Neisseria sp.]
MKRSLWIVLGIIVLIAAAVIAPQIVTESRRQWQDDASRQAWRYSRYYGLSVFLEKLYPKAKVRILHDFSEFTAQEPTHNAVMFIAETDSSSEATQQALLDWVAQGNHTVISPYLYEGRSIFAELNLPLLPVRPSKEDEAVAEQEKILPHQVRDRRLEAKVRPQVQAACTRHTAEMMRLYPDLIDIRDTQPPSPKDLLHHRCALVTSVLRLPEQAGRDYFLFDDTGYANWVFDTSAPASPIIMQADNAYGTSLVQVRHGAGSITLSNGSDLFAHPEAPTNLSAAHLNRFDNAYLAAYLAQDKPQIFILNSLQNRDAPSLLPFWAQLIKKEPLLAAIILLLLASIIWHQALRLGGKRRYDERQERPLLAHFVAQGQLIGRMREQHALLAGLQQELWQDWQRKLSGYRFGSAAQKIDLIHRLTGIAKSDVALWLQPLPETVRRRDLLRYLRAHQRIRNLS